jgi:hypothetical protein
MSLHQLANEMRNAGRGNDKMLMHMTPGEVHGLQKLAMAHGGSLTINPETGLPEAGFLSSILPMIAGFALGPAGMGLMTSMQAGLAVGAVSTLATGSLQKGIMAGLGAYGGAGLGSGLNAVGSTTTAPALGPTAIAPTSTLGNTSALANVGAAPAANISSITGQPLGFQGYQAGANPYTNFANAQSANLANTQAAQAAQLAKGPFAGTGVSAANFPRPSGPSGMPIQTRGAAQASEAADALRNEYLRANPVQAADISSIDPTVIEARNIGSTPLRPGDATVNQPFAPKNIARPDASDALSYEDLKRAAAERADSVIAASDARAAAENAAKASKSAAASNITDVKVEPKIFENYKPTTAVKPPATEYIKPYSLANRGAPFVEPGTVSTQGSAAMQGAKRATSGVEGIKDLYAAMEKDAPYSSMAAGFSTLSALNQPPPKPKKAKTLIRPYDLRKDKIYDTDVGPSSSAERRYFDTEWTALEPYEAPGPEYGASGGLARLAEGGSTLFYNEKTGKVEPKTTSSNANKISSTGQALDEYGGYRGQYGQYYNANNQPQMWYMDPNITTKEAVLARNAAGVTLPSKTAATPPVSTVEGLNELYQEQFGRAADPSAIESYIGKGYTPEQITGFLQSSEEYAPIKERKAAEAKQATYANPTQIANIYDSVLGRTPDMAGLDYYSGQNLTPAEIKQQLMQSEEYKTNLTKPFVPAISYTGSTLSYDDVKKQLGHNPTLQEIGTANRAFVPNRATIEGAPEYQTPEQRLGLAKTNALDSTPDFYAMMNKRLAAQAETKADGGVIQVPNAMDMYANGGGIQGYNLGGYSDGGRLLRGPGDGVSDGIPATIGDRQPARLADGEFVIPARIVSELGNGSTEAGAKRLYAMMARVQRARRKTVGKNKVAVNSKADKHLPA